MRLGLNAAFALERGGMAGPAIRPIALDNTNFCSQQLASCGKIVFGCGGAQDAHTIRKFLLAGAAIVQMHSAFREANEDPTFVRDILAELAQD
jgi:dihydroorotate dehydrogenase